MKRWESVSHIVAIIGGAVAGSEAAKVLSSQGVGVVIFEQNARPYGKIEEGLPRWHDKMRIAEFGRIDEAFRHPLVEFVPLTRISCDVSVAELTKEWGVSCVILATGAWRDRPLGIPGVDDFIGRGFYYQNPFMYWFNHCVEKGYQGPQCEIAEGGIVVGGGLASIDVVKVLMLETINAALRRRGISIAIDELERRGADKVLEEQGLTFEQLEVKPCTLFYRRELKEMPLVAYPENAGPEEWARVEKTRLVLLNRAMKKYFFRVQDQCRPVGKIVDGDRLVGLRFIRTKGESGRAVDIPGSEFEVRAPITVSSIGSLPERLPGIPMEADLYQWQSHEHPRLSGEEPIFGLGNVVTGRGNIAVSRKHSKEVAHHVGERHLGVAMELRDTQTELLLEKVEHGPMLTAERRARLIEKLHARQRAVGYDGDYDAWLKKWPPLEFQR